MRMSFRGLSVKTALNEMFQEETEIEAELKIKEEMDLAWRQRKYELSNSFGEEFIFFDDKLGGFYSEDSDNSYIYDVDRFGCLVISKNHLPDNLQNTRGYNYAFVSK